MAGILKCSIGVAKEEECHKLTFTHEVGLVPFGDIGEKNKHLVELRAEVTGAIINICYHHKQTLLVKYQKACCDPFTAHKHLCKSKSCISKR